MCCQHCCGLPCQQFPFCHFRLRKRLLWLWRCWLLPKHCFWQAYFSRVKRWPSATEAGSAPGVCGKGWLEKLEHLKAKNKGALAKTSEVCERVGQGNGATPRTYPGGTISTSARPNQQERLSAIQRLAESIMAVDKLQRPHSGRNRAAYTHTMSKNRPRSSGVGTMHCSHFPNQRYRFSAR